MGGSTRLLGHIALMDVWISFFLKGGLWGLRCAKDRGVRNPETWVARTRRYGAWSFCFGIFAPDPCAGTCASDLDLGCVGAGIGLRRCVAEPHGEVALVREDFGCHICEQKTCVFAAAWEL